MKTVSRVFLAMLVAASIGGLLESNVADAGQTGCLHCQDECCHTCKLEAERVDVDKKCFEVECEVICIPRVVFPWQTGKGCFSLFGHKKKGCSSCDACDGRGCDVCSACVHNGAVTRKVKILKSGTRPDCPVCEYTWSAEKKGCVTGCCRQPCNAPACGCATPACDCDTSPVYYDEVAPTPVP
jgi:hypothetical protein